MRNKKRENIGPYHMEKVGKESREDYLEAIYILISRYGNSIRSCDLAEHMGVTRPSVCNALARLKSESLVNMDEKHNITLTEEGYQEAINILGRHHFFEYILIQAGVDAETANKEACALEHAISHDSFVRLRSRWASTF